MLLVVIGYVAYTFYRQQHDWRSVWQQARQADWTSFPFLLLLALTPLNWALEARKWQVLVRRIEPLTFRQAFGGVLAGLSLGFALPSQVGDTAGRLLSLRTHRRWEGIGATLVAGGLQTYAAVLAGVWGLGRGGWGAAFVGGLLLLGAVLVRQRKRLARLPSGWLKRWERYWIVIAQYSEAELFRAFLAALTRHLTFTVQFGLALYLFGIRLPLADTLAGISVVYLGKTLVPAFNLLSDLGVREAASLLVFGQWNVPAPPLLAATLTLWLVNILMPVLVGLASVWKLKLSNG